MKHFVLKLCGFFVLIFLLLSFGLISLNSFIRYNTDFKTDKNPSYIVFGNSHPECAFNDSFISNFSNYAASGEAYFYTYIKAKEILERNTYMQVVFIEFSYTEINALTNDWIWTNKYLSKRYDEYGPFMTLNEQGVLLKNNFPGCTKYILYSAKKNLKKIINNKEHFKDELGGYLYLDKEMTGSIKNNLVKPKKIDPNIIKLSKTNIDYLQKLLNFCNTNGKKIYLIRSPLNKNFIKLEHEVILKNLLATRFEEFEFLDFAKFPIKDSEFADLDHLNYRGAQKFSVWFNNLLEKGLLNKSNKQSFINEQIELIK